MEIYVKIFHNGRETSIEHLDEELIMNELTHILGPTYHTDRYYGFLFEDEFTIEYVEKSRNIPFPKEILTKQFEVQRGKFYNVIGDKIPISQGIEVLLNLKE